MTSLSSGDSPKLVCILDITSLKLIIIYVAINKKLQTW